MLRILRFVLLLGAAATAAAATSDIAPGVHLIAGSFVPGTQPDGNSIVLDGRDGLIVIDTGRHREHTDEIIAYAKRRGLPVAAIVNTHWHLDHTGGNALLRSQFPSVRVYASDALAEARKGFLVDYRKQLVDAIAQTTDAQRQAGYRAEVALIDAGDDLGPTDVLSRTETRSIAGRRLRLGVARHAATAGDVWLFDPATRVLVSGDLVTLPAPFLDTACPEGWKRSLEEISRVDFEVLIPGHGAPMSRHEFEAYRGAFGNLLVCAGSGKTKDACIEGWITDTRTLVGEADRDFTRSLMKYYLDVLRGDPARIAKLCG